MNHPDGEHPDDQQDEATSNSADATTPDDTAPQPTEQEAADVPGPTDDHVVPLDDADADGGSAHDEATPTHAVGQDTDAAHPAHPAPPASAGDAMDSTDTDGIDAASADAFPAQAVGSAVATPGEGSRDDAEADSTPASDAAGRQSSVEVPPSDDARMKHEDAAGAAAHRQRHEPHGPVGPTWFSSRRSQFLAAILLAGLGFALVVQVGANQGDEYSTLRQSELVRLLDEATQRTNELEARARELETTRDELAQGVESDRRAEELAQEQATTEGILSGRLPATGPGIELTIIEGSEELSAATMFNILEELRNAGAEAIELNDVRVVTSTWFTRGGDGLVMDGQVLESPYHWTAIGEPTTLEPALEIAGGAMSAVRNAGAQESIRQADELLVDATREPDEPEFATPVPESSS